MKRIIPLAILSLFLSLELALAQSNFTDDTFVITTYYPAPYGVYRNMRLNPSDEPTNGVGPGVMYYNQTENMMKFYNDTTWVNMTGGGGGGYWTQSGTDIRNTNTGGNVNVTGNINATGDVCTGAGICLNTVSYQTSLIEGNSPPCPVGTKIIMKAYNGIWYTSDKGSWEKVICGTTGTSDGTPMLVGSKHTQGDCRALKDSYGAAVVPDNLGNYMCRFNTTSCDIVGWTQYNGWSTTTGVSGTAPAGSCSGYSWGACTLTVEGHAWAPNAARECNTVLSGYSSCHIQSFCELVPCTGYSGCNTCNGAVMCSEDQNGVEGYNCSAAVHVNVTQVGCF
jgi:hypothetical protein